MILANVKLKTFGLILSRTCHQAGGDFLLSKESITCEGMSFALHDGKSGWQGVRLWMAKKQQEINGTQERFCK
jgi:hypothetical protein